MDSTEPGSFLPEIRTMMYAMGDSRRPLNETAQILEEALLREIRRLITEAQQNLDFSIESPKKFFDADDLFFVLRNDRQILRRLINCLKINEIKMQINQQTKQSEEPGGQISAPEKDNLQNLEDNFNGIEEENIDAEFNGNGDSSKNSGDHNFLNFASKSLKYCEQILAQLDPSGDLASAVLSDDGYLAHDSVKRERQMRAAACAASMDTGEYMKFTEARQVSFLPASVKNNRAAVKRFLDWIFGRGQFSTEDAPTTESENFFDGFQPSALTIELLNLFAREYLSILIDCSLLVKRECSPMNPNLNLYTCSNSFLTSNKGLEWFRVRSAQALTATGPTANQKPLLQKQTNQNTFSGYTPLNSTNQNKTACKNNFSNEQNNINVENELNSKNAMLNSATNQNEAENQTNVSLGDCLLRRARLLQSDGPGQQISLAKFDDFQDTVVALQPWEVREAIRRLDYYRNFHQKSAGLNLF